MNQEHVVQAIQRVLAEIERRGMAAHNSNPDLAKGLAEAYELVAGLLTELETKP